MSTGWGSKLTPHPLIEGKTPLELEQMTLEEIRAHAQRAKQYAQKAEEEELIHLMLDDHAKGRRTLLDFPSNALKRYQECWRIARKRAGLKEPDGR